MTAIKSLKLFLHGMISLMTTDIRLVNFGLIRILIRIRDYYFSLFQQCEGIFDIQKCFVECFVIGGGARHECNDLALVVWNGIVDLLTITDSKSSARAINNGN